MRFVCAAAAAISLFACAPTDTSSSSVGPGQPPDAGTPDAGNPGNPGAPAVRAITLNASGPGAIDGAGVKGCHAQCSAQAADGTALGFTATPDPGAVFTGWSQACSGNGACAFTVSKDAQVTATFALVPPPPLGQNNLIVSRNGSGVVGSNPAGVDCGATCAAAFTSGGQVTLSATPAAGFRFSGWGGACSGQAACVVVLDADKTVYATFEAIPPAKSALAVTRSGTGTVTSTPAGIDCGATCSAQFDTGTVVTLNATPGAGNQFVGWSGACQGSGTCTVALGADASVVASFAATIVQDECTPLRPGPLPPMQKVQFPRGPSGQCLRGYADGKGNLALPVPVASSDPASQRYDVHLFDPSAATLGLYRGLNVALDEQATGFLASNFLSATTAPYLDAIDPTGHVVHEENAPGPSANGRALMVDDPTGGVVLAAFQNGWLISLESYDAQAARRWRVSFDPHLQTSVNALGTDRKGNTLLITHATGPSGVLGQWFDPAGAARPPFSVPASEGKAMPFLLVPRLGDGFFVQHTDGSGGTGRWLSQIDALADNFPRPPTWLSAYDNKKLHPARGGTAYAFLDPPGPSADCSQRGEIVTSAGKSCGFDSFNAGARGACQTLSIDVGWDGTVIQQASPAAEAQDAAGHLATCTWQWWPGAFQ